jgi:hypothetical protein
VELLSRGSVIVRCWDASALLSGSGARKQPSVRRRPSKGR